MIAAAQREEYEASLKEQFENGEITEAQYKTLVSTETQNEEYAEMPVTVAPTVDNPFLSPSEFIDESKLTNFEEQLDEEDKIYLAMK